MAAVMTQEMFDTISTDWLDNTKLWGPARARVVQGLLRQQHEELMKLRRQLNAEERINEYFQSKACPWIP